MLFHVSERRDGDRTVLAVIGDVDLATLPELAGRIARAPGEQLVVDLDAVDYFDPLCVGALVAGQLRAQRAGRSFALRCRGRIRALIEESGLARIITVLDEEPGPGSDGTTPSVSGSRPHDP